jgi:hypothetical protein
MPLLLAGCSHTNRNARPIPSQVVLLGWRAVLSDWYDDGKFEQRHPCKAVREAIEHLPPDPPQYTTVHRDLVRLERRVCPPAG